MPSSNGINDFCEKPIAAETPESGIGTTTSAVILFSFANCSPKAFL